MSHELRKAVTSVDAINNRAKLTEAERLDRLRLMRSDNVGPRTVRSLLNHFGSARQVLARLPELAQRGCARQIRICSEKDAAAELEASTRFGISLLAPEEDGYPPRPRHHRRRATAFGRAARWRR